MALRFNDKASAISLLGVVVGGWWEGSCFRSYSAADSLPRREEGNTT
jgi:hypothetical protein